MVLKILKIIMILMILMILIILHVSPSRSEYEAKSLSYLLLLSKSPGRSHASGAIVPLLAPSDRGVNTRTIPKG